MPNVVSSVPKQERDPKYPWEEWADLSETLPEGEALEFVAGDDFTCSAASFASSAYQWYKGHGYDATINTRQGNVYLRARKIGDGEVVEVKPRRGKKKVEAAAE